jgi:hypothetical protein
VPARTNLSVILALLLMPGGTTVAAAEPAPSAETSEFFEKSIRPVLVEHCYKCHSDTGKEPKGGLRVDSRSALLKGGDTGPAIVPGQPDKSILIAAIRYGNVDLQMPPRGKLPAKVIADFERWVREGAVWPESGNGGASPPAAGATVKPFDLASRKNEHWSWQPVRRPELPAVKNMAWPLDPIDRFVLAKLESAGLKPAPPADRLTWLRRVSFALTGLPPTPAEIEAFLADPSESAYPRVVDRLLASPHFGERWGRHWLDLVRYAESRGHEYDPSIANAWQYRDYVIRAFNADLPYNQFVLEHLAGDLLEEPRLNPVDGCNESILGTGFWHLGEEVHSPVDIRQDQADRLDNRIDVLSKTFLGLTVSCARCHDHKFDAISIQDYYALFGILEGSSYRQVRFDHWRENRQVAAELAELRRRTDAEVAKLAVAGSVRSATPTDVSEYQKWWSQARVIVDYADLKPGQWLPDDVTYGPAPRPAGSLQVRKKGETLEAGWEPRTAAVFDRFWSGLRRHPESERIFGALGGHDRAGFTIRTPNVILERKTVYALLRGGGEIYAGVCGHTVITGPLHHRLVQKLPDSPEYRWVAVPLEGYLGQRLHLEFTANPETEFAVAMVVQSDIAPPSLPPESFSPPKLSADILQPLLKQVARDEASLASRVHWESRLAPALLDGTPVDEAVFLRGNPRTLGPIVRRRCLEALPGSRPIESAVGSGRRELAQQLIDPERNPYISRVLVNRIWHHLFGRGIVPSTDNFGVLGEAPSHPELLDFLASEFVGDQWSMKRLIRRLVLSQTYRMSSEAPPSDADPSNVLLHRFRVKRLEGEAIRDALLQISGSLKPTIGGKSVPIHLTAFLEGRGRPQSGPLDGDGRRSIYLAVRRNFLSPFLIAFDTPIPFSTVGRRQVSNVPAQALILLNDPFVHELTRRWAARLLAEPGTVEDRLRRMYLEAFARPPSDAEIAACREFLENQVQDFARWSELTHTLVNLKEFSYLK